MVLSECKAEGGTKVYRVQLDVQKKSQLQGQLGQLPGIPSALQWSWRTAHVYYKTYLVYHPRYCVDQNGVYHPDQKNTAQCNRYVK